MYFPSNSWSKVSNSFFKIWATFLEALSLSFSESRSFLSSSIREWALSLKFVRILMLRFSASYSSIASTKRFSIFEMVASSISLLLASWSLRLLLRMSILAFVVASSSNKTCSFCSSFRHSCKSCANDLLNSLLILKERERKT